jgi:hypothetical protein
MRNFLGRAALMVCATCILLVWAVLTFVSPSHKRALAPDGFQQNGGCAYTIELPLLGNMFVEHFTDSMPHPKASRLRVYEGDRELGPGHAAHNQVRSDGNGAFSHWGNSLYLSASDCSNPRTNGKAYSIVVPYSPSLPVQVLGWLSLLVIVGQVLQALSRKLKEVGSLRKYLAQMAQPVWQGLTQSQRSDHKKAFKQYGLAAVAIVTVGGWVGLELISIKVVDDIAVQRIQADTGCSYTTGIPRAPGWPFTTIRSDESDGQSSVLRLFENGVELGPAHATHSDIRERGQGRYSHWNHVLYFSTTDCSNPTKNSRKYSVATFAEPSLGVRLFGVCALLYLISLFWRRSSVGMQSRLRQIATIALRDSIAPASTFAIPWILLLVSAILTGLASISLTYLWSSGKSLSIAAASFYQVTDASGYWTCSNSLLDSGNFGNQSEWCQRRSTYSYLLAGIVALGGRTIQGTLILQAAILSFALGLLVRQGARMTGWIGSILVVSLFLPYFYSNAWALTMTENAGLAFGLSGVAILLRASELLSPRWIFAGCALISIALNARAGAFFVLPMLIIWSVLAARITQNKMITWGLHALAGCSIGFLLQFIMVLMVGGDPARTHGNFSYTLYGLSVGGLGWSRVLIDHPELASMSDSNAARAIYRLAYSNILSDPSMFLNGLGSGLGKYLRLVGFGADIPLRLSLFATCLWYLSWIPLWIRRRDPSYLLIGLAALGVLLAAPLLVHDGGPRVFAATLAFDAIQISIALVWVIGIVVHKIFPQTQSSRPIAEQSATPEVAFGVMVAILIMIPFVYRLALFEELKPIGMPCKVGEKVLVTRIGYESPLLDIVETGHDPAFTRGEVERTAFAKGLPTTAWWAPRMESFSWKSILLGQQLDHRDGGKPGPYGVLSDEHLAPYYGKRVRICMSGEPVQNLFGAPYRKLESIEVMK